MNTSYENRERVSHAHPPRVVIVGGGFGGLYAARGLARAPVTVTVVDKHNYHLSLPMLFAEILVQILETVSGQFALPCSWPPRLIRW